MEFAFIVFLGIVLIVVWRSGRDTTNELRAALEALERRVDSLQAHIAALTKAAAAKPAAAEAPTAAQPSAVRQPSPESSTQTRPVLPVEPPLPVQPAAEPATPIAASAHSAPPADAAFTPAWKRPIEAPPVPVVLPQPVSAPPFMPPIPPLAKIDPPPAAAPPEPPPARPFSLEERLGKNWLNKIGIACVVIGIASFLAIKLETWGPAGKVLSGYAVSLVLLAGGVWLERKAVYRVFARAGIGGGWALAFFTTYALHHVTAAHVLDSLLADLVLMLLVAAGMVAHSLRYRSQTVTGLAFLLGFATLLTSHIEAGGDNVVFSLAASAVLAVALVVVTTLRHWAWLELTGLIAVYISHFIWLCEVLPANHAAFAEFWPSTLLILLYWLIFRLAYVFRTPLDQNEETISSLSAVLNSTGVLGLLKFQSAHPEWAAVALAALGVAEMALAFRARARRRQAFVVLSTIATILLVAAVPFRFHGVSWPVLWLVEAQVLALAGLRLGEPVFRRLGLLAGLVTGGVLAIHDVLPLFLLRLDAPDPGGHASLTVALALAALLFWVHGEIYPRRWPQIAENENEAFALRVTSWLGLFAAAGALWVAMPDLWLPLGWLALVLLTGFAGRRFNSAALGFQADFLALATGGVLAFHHVLPLAFFRLDNPDSSRHPALTAMLCLAAAAYWVHAEVFPRVLRRRDPSYEAEFGAWRGLMEPAASILGSAAAGAALWVVLPAPWVMVGWLGLVLLLGIAADLVKGQTLAVEADLLAVASAAAFFACDLWTSGWRDHTAPLIAAVALLYAGMRRKTVPTGSPRFVAPLYSWAATLVLAYGSHGLSSYWSLTPIWAVLGLALFEIGRFACKGFLRWQGYLLIALAFANYLGDDLPNILGGVSGPFNSRHFSLTGSLLVGVLVLAAAGYWLLERTRSRCSRTEHIVGIAADALGSLSLLVWLQVRLPFYEPGAAVWITAIWAAMAATLLALAWLMRRRPFLVQAVALAVLVVLRGFVVDLFTAPGAGFWQGSLFHLGLTAAILLAALPFAFQLRGPDFWTGASFHFPAEIETALSHPEQWFFFAPFALEVVVLAVKLSSGRITIGWSLLGVGTFLFALAVGERSYRLAGLGLLMVSVVKIPLIDYWSLTQTDRYITLIVLGAALLVVSFLYTRFGSVIRKFL
jgi:hypothetical protein